MKKYLCLILACCTAACMLSGCGKTSDDPDTSSGSNAMTTAPAVVQSVPAVSDGDMFTDRDLKAEAGVQTIAIRFDNDVPVCSSPAVSISGTTVTILQEGCYTLSGNAADGCVIVDTNDNAKVQLLLDNLTLNRKASAPVYVRSADKVFITLPDGSNSTLSCEDILSTEDDTIDGAIFSKSDLTINGSGTLTISSAAGHGIVCKDDLVFTGGNHIITSASHGIDANDSIRITNTGITINAGKDGIHTENNDDSALGFVYISNGTFDINAQGDGISTGSYMNIKDGTFQILAGGGYENGEQKSSNQWGDFMGGGMGGGRPGHRAAEIPTTSTTDDSTSMKGLKAGGSLLITGGDFRLDTADDTLHGAVIDIQGGTFRLDSGDDGVHADQTLTITDCDMEISHSYEGLEAKDITISGGLIKLKATDDGLNAAGGNDGSGMSGGRDMMFGDGRPGGMQGNATGSITITGGSIIINASGDGIDANGTLLISGGYVCVSGPTVGDTATLDYDISAEITGGTFIGTGAANMAQTFSSSTQGVIAVTVGNQPAGTTITLSDNDGNLIISHTSELNYGVVILSTFNIKKGETYTITVGSETASFEAY